jgi:hypothetical protein
MGIDKSLTDDFPTVSINGREYHYGRETEYGQYLVENAEYAKDHWCFDTREDLVAFLTNLPESADPDWFKRRYPDWHEASEEQRDVYRKERDAHFRRLTEEKEKDGTSDGFTVLTFDGAGWFVVNADPMRRFECDSLDVVVCKQEKDDGKEYVVELRPRPTYDEPEKQILRISRGQALKLASALVRTALEIEAMEKQ